LRGFISLFFGWVLGLSLFISLSGFLQVFHEWRDRARAKTAICDTAFLSFPIFRQNLDSVHVVANGDIFVIVISYM